MLNEKTKKIFIIASCCFLISLCFFFTVQMRSEWLTKSLNGHLSRETAHTACVTKNWLKEGALNLRFLYISWPDSEEYDIIQKRGPYVSYPPGAIFPVFILAKIFQVDNLVLIISSYNLATQYIIAILLFLLMFMVLEYFKEAKGINIFFSIIPSSIYLYTPPTLYWHMIVYFADEAVMVLFALFVFLETKRYLYKGLSRMLNLVSMAVVFLGTLTDWLFVFIVLIAIALRMFFDDKLEFSRRRILSMLDLIAPAGLAIGLFLYQIVPLGLFEKLVSTFSRRHLSGPDGVVSNLFVQHFYYFVISLNGYILCVSAVICSIFLLFCYYSAMSGKWNTGNKEVIKVYTRLALLVTLPCCLQIYIFQQHSIVHDFSALKWSLPLALIPFGIFPLLFNQLIKYSRRYQFIIRIFLAVYILLLILGIFHRTLDWYKRLFQLWKQRDIKISEVIKDDYGRKDPCFYLFLENKLKA